jgi:dihydroanticapsin dehydrogenase
MDLKGKVAIITGAANSEGIGYTTARKFLEYGVEGLVLTDVSKGVVNRWEELSREFPEAKIVVTVGDITNSEFVELIVRQALGITGKIDVLVNNAAVNIPGDSLELSPENFKKHFEVNVYARYLLNREVLPHMRKECSGSIVNVSSANAIVAEKRLVGYGMTKGADRQQTMFDGLDNAPYGIRVNSVGPGLVNTGFNDAHHDKVDGGREEVMKHIKEIQPTGVPVPAEDVANMILFLASDLSKSCIGGFYLVDGGFSIK